MSTLKKTIKKILGVITNNKLGVSTDYKIIYDTNVDNIVADLKNSWKDSHIPQRQWEIVSNQIESFKHGKSVDVFNSLIDIMKRNIRIPNTLRVLEIGCSSGYYSEVFKCSGLNVNYEGCDYSPSFIDFAKKTYPDRKFSVQDAVDLRYEDNSFDAVISGGCLLHIQDYKRAIQEAARVARRYVIFHRTPILPKSPTTYYTKKAYGVQTFEIHFNEKEIIGLFKASALKLIDDVIISSGTTPEGIVVHNKTYFCEKM